MTRYFSQSIFFVPEIYESKVFLHFGISHPKLDYFALKMLFSLFQHHKEYSKKSTEFREYPETTVLLKSLLHTQFLIQAMQTQVSA